MSIRELCVQDSTVENKLKTVDEAANLVQRIAN